MNLRTEVRNPIECGSEATNIMSCRINDRCRTEYWDRSSWSASAARG